MTTTHEEPLEATLAPRSQDRSPSDPPAPTPGPQEPLPADPTRPEDRPDEPRHEEKPAVDVSRDEPPVVPGLTEAESRAGQAQRRELEPETPGVQGSELSTTPVEAAWAQAHPAAEARDTSQGKPSTTWLPGLVLILFFLFAVTAATAFKWWRYDYAQTERNLGEMEAQVAALSTELEKLGGESSALAAKEAELAATLGGKDSELAADLADLHDAHKRLGDSVAELALRAPGAADDLVLAEVEMLVAMAQQRLDLERDATTALAAMEAADRRLHQLARAGLKAVREQVIHDANEIRAVPVPDVQGISLRLADLIRRVEDLPLLGDLRPSAPPPANAVEPPPIEDWADLLRAIWADLQNLVSVRPLESTDPMWFDPQFQGLLKQSLKLEIANARADLRQRDSASFRASLDLASDTLDRYFDTEAPATASVLEALEELRALDLSPPVPDVSGSLRALRNYARTQQRVASPVAPESRGSAPSKDRSVSNASDETADAPLTPP